MSLTDAFPIQLLLVEDSPEILDLLKGLLADEEGYCVTEATSLSTAHTMLDEKLFHLVLTDLFSSDWRRFDPLQSIHPLLTQAAPTPVGVFTAWSVSSQVAAQANLAFLLEKPYGLYDVQRAVQNVVYSMRSRPRQAEAVKEFFAALNVHDWKHLERLCMPDIAVFPLSASSLDTGSSPGRPYTSLSGLEHFFWEQLFLGQSGLAIEEVRVYNHPMGVATRYLARWQDSDGRIHRSAKALYFRFQGERIALIEGAL